MGSKRKSMGENSSSSAPTSISIDSSKASVQPVVASFAAAIPPLASSFATYRSIDKNRADDCIVVSETEKI
ncbi:hypothetical protein EV175_004701, partial [Coemansia sp. RSA 1933]